MTSFNGDETERRRRPPLLRENPSSSSSRSSSNRTTAAVVFCLYCECLTERATGGAQQRRPKESDSRVEWKWSGETLRREGPLKRGCTSRLRGGCPSFDARMDRSTLFSCLLPPYNKLGENNGDDTEVVERERNRGCTTVHTLMVRSQMRRDGWDCTPSACALACGTFGNQFPPHPFSPSSTHCCIWHVMQWGRRPPLHTLSSLCVSLRHRRGSTSIPFSFEAVR